MIVAEALVALAELPARMVTFLSGDRSEALVALDSAPAPAGIAAHVGVVTALARSYTRRRGFTGTYVEEPLAAVITTAAARSITNPDATVREEIGAESRVFTPFLGWSLVELAVLNGYRRTAA